MDPLEDLVLTFLCPMYWCSSNVNPEECFFLGGGGGQFGEQVFFIQCSTTLPSQQCPCCRAFFPPPNKVAIYSSGTSGRSVVEHVARGGGSTCTRQRLTGRQ